MVDWLIDWFIDWSVNCLFDWLNYWLIDWSVNCLFDWLNYWLIDWLIDWWIELLIDWLVGWLIVYLIFKESNSWAVLFECVSLCVDRETADRMSYRYHFLPSMKMSCVDRRGVMVCWQRELTESAIIFSPLGSYENALCWQLDRMCAMMCWYRVLLGYFIIIVIVFSPPRRSASPWSAGWTDRRTDAPTPPVL